MNKTAVRPRTLGGYRRLRNSPKVGRRVYRVSLFGGPGSGKTSTLLLINQVASEGGAPVTATPEVRVRLAAPLKQQTTLVAGRQLAAGPGLEPTTFPVDYPYIVTGDEHPGCLVSIRDLPGDQCLQVKDRQDEIVAALRESVAVIAPCDAAALMETPHDGDSAKPAGVLSDVLTKAWAQRRRPGLVLIPLVKCERYLTEQRQDDLFAAVKQAYRPLFMRLASARLTHRSAVVVVPVETAGGVVFSHTEPEGTSGPQLVFRKRKADAVLAPTGGDKLVKALLRFLVAQEMAADRGRNGTLRRFYPGRASVWYRSPALRNWLIEGGQSAGLDSSLGDGATFEVIHGQDMLEAPE